MFSFTKPTAPIAQQWILAYNAQADAYTFTNPNGNRLDLANSDITPGNNIRLWSPNDSCAELFRIIPDQDGSYTIASACSPEGIVDRSNGETTNGTNIQVWNSNNTLSQRWFFHQTANGSGSVSTPIPPPPPQI